MSKRKKIMIDMDDVICKGGFLKLINKYLKSDYKESDFKDFYMQDVLPDKDAFFKYCIEENLYDYGELEPNVKEVMENLNKVYDIYIGTSYIFREIPRESGIFLLRKHNYLQEKLPFLNQERYIFLSNKSLLNCEIKIDDRIDNLEGAERKLLYNAYHNLEIDDGELVKQGVERVNGWLDIQKKLL